ncbi:amidohydrolase family protein [Halostella salina]|uniref:amidohydrolase family protein n=1 Tax=Halostella salina TaxID=1547897 RepID=UPI000EF780C5|nr:amidohydrolase family protein [Halostella salina]
MTDTTTIPAESSASSNEISLVDADIHQRWADDEEITQYLPPRYKDDGIVAPTLLYRNPGGFFRQEDVADDGTKPGTDLEKLASTHLDENNIDYGMLTGNSWFNLAALPNRDYAVELARAYNEWLVNDCLPVDDRFLGSLYVAPKAPEESAELIREYGDNPQIRQVMIPGGAEVPYGRPQYWPMYEAAEEMNLAIAVHPFSEGHGTSNAPTGAGHPNSYIEWHTLLGAYYMGQLASIVTEGVFVEYPDLRWAFIEGGYGWLPHFMWRLDKNWKGLRSQAPWLEQRPSQYIRDNVWFASQPIEEPETPEQHNQILDMMHADEMLVFASDYPHWDGDDPTWGLPPMEDSVERAVRYENAMELWDLPRNQ